MKNLVRHLSLWNSLLALSLTIILYLVTVQINEALSYPAQATHFREHNALISWPPSSGPVDHYLMEVTDTKFFSGSGQKNALTTIRQIRSPLPFYQLICEHNHSYQVRVKAVSPSGNSSAYSENSVLFICDQKKPDIVLSASSQVTSSTFSLAGSFYESNLDSITVNGIPATVNAAKKCFEATVMLAAGHNLIDIIAWDLAGNTTTKEMEITYTPLSVSDDRLSPFEVDYDHDGSKDLLVGTAEGMVALLTNRGTDAEPAFSDYRFLKVDGKEIDVGTHATPFMVDYNNDGTPDLLIGNGEGALFYYANQGNTIPPVFAPPVPLKDLHGTHLAVDGYCTPCVVDWDDDNRKDILLGSGSGELVLYRNEGSDSEPLFSPPTHIEVDGITVTVTSHAVPVVADWDGDGGKDLLVRNKEGHLYLFRNGVVSGEPDLSRAEIFLKGELEPASDRFPVPIPFYWNQHEREQDPRGNSYNHLYPSL